MEVLKLSYVVITTLTKITINIDFNLNLQLLYLLMNKNCLNFKKIYMKTLEAV